MKVTHTTAISLVICSLWSYTPCCRAEIKGSDTKVSIIYNSPVFPARDTDNTMLDFGYFQGGFTLQDATTSCTFDSIFPVSGIINMHGGKLFLLKDLVFTEPLSLEGLGTIIGNNHIVKFCESVTSLPSNFSLMKDVNLIFTHDVEINSNVRIQGNCNIQCAGTTITFNNNARFVIGHNATLEIHDATLENVGDSTSKTTISCTDNTGLLRLDNTTVVLADDWTFANGCIHFKNSSAIVGPHNLNYTSDMPPVIEAFSTLSNNQELDLVFGNVSQNY